MTKKISQLPIASVTMDDIVPLVDTAITSRTTLQNIYDLFVPPLTTLFGGLYAKYLWDADFYKYSISRTVDGSGNMTVTVLNYLGDTPSASAPIKYQDWSGTIRTISSALTVTFNAWTNYLNCWSAELATKEIDYFVYFQWNTTTSTTNLLGTRFPSATFMSDITNSNTNEKGAMGIINYNSTDRVVNIGRFNATLSAGAWYTWSIPATSRIINSLINESRYIDIVPVVTPSGSMTYTSLNILCKYKITWNAVDLDYFIEWTTWWTASNQIRVSLPFSTALWTFQLMLPAWILDNLNQYSATAYNDTSTSTLNIRKYDVSNYTLWASRQVHIRATYHI